MILKGQNVIARTTYMKGDNKEKNMEYKASDW